MRYHNITKEMTVHFERHLLLICRILLTITDKIIFLLCYPHINADRNIVDFKIFS